MEPKGPTYLPCGCIDRYEDDRSLMCEEAMRIVCVNLPTARTKAEETGDHTILDRVLEVARRHVHSEQVLAT